MKKISVLLAVLFLISSCSVVDSGGEAQKRLGKDSYYFLGLKDADSGDEKEAVRKFKISRGKGSELVAMRSAESLTLLGSVKERISSSVYLTEHFADEEAQVFACRELYRDGEFSKVIEITDGLDLAKSSNELIALRMFSLIEKEDSRLENEFYRWFVSRPLSAEHLEIYQSYKDLEFRKLERIQKHARKFQEELDRYRILEHSSAPEFDRNGDIVSEVLEPQTDFEDFFTGDSEIESPRQTIIGYRIAVYRRKYLECFRQIDKILSIFDNFGEKVECQILSDIGKAALYGTDDYFATARKFDRMAKNLDSEQSFYAYFYAARLYDKAGRYRTQTLSRFRSALENAADGNQFDNCLWYLLNFQLRTSTDDIISTLKTYGSKINSPSYFDDFFDSLSVLLLSSHKWQDFFEVWKETNSNFSEETQAKYAYISGRLIEEGLAKGAEGLKTRQTVDAFTKVLGGGGSLYYKVCALERLNLSEDEMIRSMMLSKEKIPEIDEISDSEQKPAGKLLSGYAAFGFPHKIYTEYLAVRDSLSVFDFVNASRFLNRCALLDSANKNDYNVQSLRIASRGYNSAKGKIPLELLELTFPRFYKNEIEKACAENGIPEYLLYALVRSESFFDSQAASHAGASGLTQLMDSTAADEAKKAKIEEYDILEPETNLMFGSHYLSNLIDRVPEKNKLLALFAYNAGLTHVRGWISAAQKDWAASTGNAPRGPCGIPADLFLETLPFSETREYGRKLVSAAAIYGWLYENRTPAETVRELLY